MIEMHSADILFFLFFHYGNANDANLSFAEVAKFASVETHELGRSEAFRIYFFPFYLFPDIIQI